MQLSYSPLLWFRAGRRHHTRGVTELYFVVRLGSRFRGAHNVLILGPGLRPVRRQDTPPERRVPYVQAFHSMIIVRS
jgi:hypothetical protein